MVNEWAVWERKNEIMIAQEDVISIQQKNNRTHFILICVLNYSHDRLNHNFLTRIKMMQIHQSRGSSPERFQVATTTKGTSNGKSNHPRSNSFQTPTIALTPERILATIFFIIAIALLLTWITEFYHGSSTQTYAPITPNQQTYGLTPPTTNSTQSTPSELLHNSSSSSKEDSPAILPPDKLRITIASTNIKNPNEESHSLPHCDISQKNQETYAMLHGYKYRIQTEREEPEYSILRHAFYSFNMEKRMHQFNIFEVKKKK